MRRGAGRTFPITGWAADVAAATGTGISSVHVWALPNPGSGQPSIFLGLATYGSARPDVGAYLGSGQFTNSGFSLTTTLAPGVYTLFVHPFSTVTGTNNQVQSLTITVAASQPVTGSNAPAAGSTVGRPFTVWGWAVDLGAPSGPGVDAVHVWAVPNGTGTPLFLGAATYGVARPEVAAWAGHARFTNCGYELLVTNLAPGYYRLEIGSRSTVSGGWHVDFVWVTVQ